MVYMPMIIGIDISQIVYQTGVSRYTKDLVRSLLNFDKENTYKLYAGVLKQLPAINDFLNQLHNEGYNFKSYVYPIPPKLADKFWNHWRFFKIEKLVGKIDVWHSSNWVQPKTDAFKVTTIHDLTPILYPDYHDPLVISNFKRNLDLIEKYTDIVVVDSRATKQDLLTNSCISAQKIEVVYPGVDLRFAQVSSEQKNQMLQKYKLDNSYILSVGTREPRKNCRRLIEAFNSLDNKKTDLVLVGKYGWGKQEENRDKQIKELGFVHDNELISLYGAAKIFVYPSLYEGFGFPVLEAMACGCPVITSNISSLPEVVGDAALLVYPKDGKEIAKAMNALLADEKLRQNLVKKGLEQVKKFNWEKTAKEMIQIYQRK